VAKFVEWPEGWSSGPFQIAVAADEDFATILTTVTRNSRLHDREIRVRRLDDDDEDCRCHLLFVSAPEDRRAALLLRGALELRPHDWRDDGVSSRRWDRASR
jgi:YfiR/HmsC-like